MTLGEVAATLLEGFIAQLKAQSIEVPERTYVAPGNLIPFDGEQLVVSLQDVGQGQPGSPFAGSYVPGAEILMAQFAIALVREVPALTGEGFVNQMVPEAEELGVAGVAAVEDVSALVFSAIAIHKAHLVTEGGLQGFEVGPCSTIGPEGGLAAARLLVSVSLS